MVFTYLFQRYVVFRLFFTFFFFAHTFFPFLFSTASVSRPAPKIRERASSKASKATKKTIHEVKYPAEQGSPKRIRIESSSLDSSQTHFRESSNVDIEVIQSLPQVPLHSSVSSVSSISSVSSSASDQHLAVSAKTHSPTIAKSHFVSFSSDEEDEEQVHTRLKSTPQRRASKRILLSDNDEE